MKLFKFALLIVGVALIFFGVRPVSADGVINWEGHGSENLPCEFGGHWVLAPAFGIDSAVLTVNGSDYTMSQSGNGSWSADSSGPLDQGLTAYVSYTGPGDEQDSLQLSHCIGGEPTPTPTTPPPPTETPTPTETPPTPTETPPGPTQTPTVTQPTPTNTPGPSATPTKPPVPTSTPTEPNTGGGTSSYPKVMFAVLGLAAIALGIIIPNKLK
jgi:hypothetical protein